MSEGWEVAEGGGDVEVVGMGEQESGKEVGQGAEYKARSCEVKGAWVAGLGLPGEQGDEGQGCAEGVGGHGREGVGAGDDECNTCRVLPVWGVWVWMRE